MSYTSVFGGNTIYPSDVSLLAIALDADTELEWPLESSGNLPPAARIIDVTPDASGRSILLPDATLTGAGQTILFNNLSGSYSFFVKDNAGNTLATIAYGEQWQLYLAATTTAAGTWRVFRYGASTATVQPSALAGYGLTVTSSTLSQSLPVTTFSTTGLTVATSNRASAFVWNGTGAGTLNLLTAASAGNNFFVFVRNSGGGDLTIDPAGTETINDASTLVLRPSDSATLITDGSEWYTIGLGQDAVFAFDYTSIAVTGGTYTLAGSELNRIAYKFTGTLTSDVYVVVPSTIQQYWVNNQTSGAFSLYIQTSGGTPTQVSQGAKGIYYCDGVDMILASDPTTLSTPVVVAQGGTGATTQSGARLGIGISTFADAIVTATTGASVRTTIGAAASGANGDITSITGLTTALSVAQGGTGGTTQSTARSGIGAQETLVSGTNIKTINGTSVLGSGNIDTTTGVIPAGVILLWSGSAASIPAGWVLCDGTSGTPNLRDRFVVGAGSTYAVGATGGSANAIVVSHTHTASVTDPGHTHTASVTDPGHTHNLPGSTSSGGINQTQIGVSSTSVNATSASATTGISVTNSSATTGISVGVSTTGSSATNANLPPYYALCYIMKT